MKQQRRRPTASSSGPALSGAGPTQAPTSNQAAQEALEQIPEPERESLLHRGGEAFGMGAGVLVTQLLELVPGWTDDLMDQEGRPVQSIPGAEREGDYNLEKRHKQVAGPAIAEYADGLDEGWWKDLVDGVAEGATDAPGATYRMEARLMEWLGMD